MRHLIAVLGISLSLASIDIFARDYQLELIVFERLEASNEAEELWLPDSNQVLKHQRELDVYATQRFGTRSANGVSRLKRVESNLINSGYRVLHAMHWRQPAKVYQNAPVMRISNPANGLDGYLKVYKTSLIFADINLGLSDTFQSAQGPLYFIQEKRRMKFKEVHYFDHPRFGAILTVWPAEG